MVPRNVAAMIHRHGNVPNTTRAVEWYHACRGGNLPPATFRIQPVWLNGTIPRHVIPRERKRVEESSQAASFTLCWFIEQRGGFLRSLCSVGTTYVFGFGRYKFKCTTIPAPGGRMAADCRRYTGFVHCDTICSIQFNYRNVAGGRLPVELWCDCPRQSIDFDSLREAPPLQTLTDGPK